MRVLVTGSNGQLGSEIGQLAIDYQNLELIFEDLPGLDICNYNSLESFIVDNEVDVVINCAAYTAVDKAEEDIGIAENVNKNGVSNLVSILKKVDGKLIHISTDYVFSGDHYMPYSESDAVSPMGVYGMSKREGELAVLNGNLDAIIIRTSWLYSSFGNNFVKTILRLGEHKEELSVVVDQVGTPTYAKDLAKICLDILSDCSSSTMSQNGKLYHYSNEGLASWYDVASSIMRISGVKCKVNPIETKEYPTLAKRPHYSVLNKAKIKKDFQIEIPYWRDSLEICIEKIKKL